MYYKVILRKNIVHDKKTSLLERNYSNNNVIDNIIVKKNLLSAQEIYSDLSFPIIKKDKAPYTIGYFILKDDFNNYNIATFDEVATYMESFNKKARFYQQHSTQLKKEKDQKTIKEYLKRK